MPQEETPTRPEIRNFGLMLCKNEAPILRDVMRANTRFVKDIYVLDGGDDGSEAILREFPEVKFYIHERELFSRRGKFEVLDGVRAFLFEEIKKTAREGDWVTIMHGDEIFHHDPNEAIVLASFSQSNTISWYSAFFFPHKDDWPDWERLKALPLEERFLHYAHYGDHGYEEFRQFKIEPGMYYNPAQHSRVVPEGRTLVDFVAFPVFKHYKVWDLDPAHYDLTEFDPRYGNAAMNAKDKWGSIRYAPRELKDFFIENFPKFTHCSRFDGSFGPLEASYDQAKAQIAAMLEPKGVTIDSLRQYLLGEA